MSDIRIAVTMICRDEMDILPAWLDHYRTFADDIIIMDNLSVDGTREFLQAQEGIHYLEENTNDYKFQKDWLNRMAQIALDRGNTHLISADADELWICEDWRAFFRRYADYDQVRIKAYMYRTTEADPDDPDPVRRIQYREPRPSDNWTKNAYRLRRDMFISRGSHFCTVGVDDGKTQGKKTFSRPGEAKINHYFSRGWPHYRTKAIVRGEYAMVFQTNRKPTESWHMIPAYETYLKHELPGLWRHWATHERARSQDMTHDPYVPSIDKKTVTATAPAVSMGTTCRRITAGDGHFFFGYYDVQPWSECGTYHLAHRVPFMDRMQTPTDRADVGIVRLGDCRFFPLAETYAWNFQQGAMLRWIDDRRIAYSSIVGGAFRTVIHDIHTGAERALPRALATVSDHSAFGLGVNFSRMYNFRLGYGYAGIPDPHADHDAPSDDGVWRVDIETGEDRLILGLDKIQKAFGAAKKILVNHINLAPGGERFVVLVRSMGGRGWKTAIMTANASDGGDLHVLPCRGMASHYAWRDDRHILIWADSAGKPALVLMRDRTDEIETVDAEYFADDGHCSYSPDGGRILYDSYPQSHGLRSVMVYDVAARQGQTLGAYRSIRHEDLPCVDMRCDLHPRWSRDGAAISFDSIHEGQRHIYVIA